MSKFEMIGRENASYFHEGVKSFLSKRINAVGEAAKKLELKCYKIDDELSFTAHLILAVGHVAKCQTSKPTLRKYVKAVEEVSSLYRRTPLTALQVYDLASQARIGKKGESFRSIEKANRNASTDHLANRLVQDN